MNDSLKYYRYAVLLLSLLLWACASTPLPAPEDPAATRCMEFYAAMDQAVAQHGATPTSPFPIAGFPHLRVDRFTASWREQPMTPSETAAWLARLAKLGLKARAVELASLPPEVATQLADRYGDSPEVGQTLANCSGILQAHDLRHEGRLEALRQRAWVPSAYRSVNRVLGLYPLTALPVRMGVLRWQQQTRRVFAMPLTSIPVRGGWRRFQPPRTTPAVAVALTDRLPQDALGIPDPSPEQLDNLFFQHAPTWEIDVAGVYDLPGAPRWTDTGIPTVDFRRAVVYYYPSYTRWRGTTLLQLNYVVWFAQRPPMGPFDLLGGALDGLIWRVTLNRTGTPLLYDTIHACGCYHLFFPTPALRLQADTLDLPEPPLVPQQAPQLAAGENVVVRIASASHYVQRVYAAQPEGELYRLRLYEALYAVPDGEKRRSLFGPDGLVAGTQRLERWLLWPMGVVSPGAMRDRGHHATAFVGRRHFDDPDLLERLFEPPESSDLTVLNYRQRPAKAGH